MKQKIKRCPVCGADAVLHELFNDTKTCVKCTSCGFQSPWCLSDDGAIGLWDALHEIISERTIKDDDGCIWIFADRRIRLVAAEVESTEDGFSKENGYFISDMSQARSCLRVGGYL